MDRLRDYHTKWRKSERERQISYDITYMWNPKYDPINIFMKQNVSQIQRTDLWLQTGGGVGREGLGVWD